jgi:diaminopimelate decarboxylase
VTTWDDFARVLPQTAAAERHDPYAAHPSLIVGGCAAVDLAREHGTPLMVLDEATLRDRLRRYAEAFGPANVTYAAKAFLTKSLIPVLHEEGVSVDCASGGELYTALAGGMPAARIVLHGNNKSAAELEQALDAGVGTIVIDSLEELIELDRLAGVRGARPRVLIRITPGIEAHTHEYLKTGIEDTKFGVPIGEPALDVIGKAAVATNLDLRGLHSHIGSQILETAPFAEAARVMTRFLADARRAAGLELPELDLGGGLGIAYTKEDEPPAIEALAKVVLEAVASEAERLGTPVPQVRVEPGRSVIGPAMITLYTAGVVKDVPGTRRYVAIDGGMSDNIRPSLYGASYTFLSATRPMEPHRFPFAVAGKLCETGDVLTKQALLPDVEAGEIIAVAATGAYGYAMASNYNKQPKPAIVMVGDGRASLLARRETYDDLVRLES